MEHRFEKCDREADVVVVGFGGAGMATAITAHDAGASVLILEKAPESEAGGNTRVSLQLWLSPIPVDQSLIYFNALCGTYTVIPEVASAWVEEMAKNTEWITGLGGEAVVVDSGIEKAEFPELPGAECVRTYRLRQGLGHEHLWKLLKGAVDTRRIEVLYSAPGKTLIQHPTTKEIIGIQAEHEGEMLSVKAKRAVVLTCGGFENNQEMVRDFLPDLPYCYPWGTPHNSGDGIKMAMAVGADLWHMNNIAGPSYHFKTPELPATMALTPLSTTSELFGGMILVGANARRFVNEKPRFAHGKMRINGQWTKSPTPCPMFMIFDQNQFSGGPLCDNKSSIGWMPLFKLYHWSQDNQAELAKGWIKRGNTVSELAEKIRLDKAVLEDTVNQWNQGCQAGKDPEYGRSRGVVPFKDGPCYAIEVSPGFLNTQGGPRRNARARIVRPDGSPIQRLYSAGELGSIYSYLYQGGGNLGDCLASGRIAGRNAAAEKPWDEE
jgi:succinate dehydrogenase/fumarate reductase flavoprotein subunit